MLRLVCSYLFFTLVGAAAENRDSATPPAKTSEDKASIHVLVAGFVEPTGSFTLSDPSLYQFIANKLKVDRFTEDVLVQRQKDGVTRRWSWKLKDLTPKNDFRLEEGDRLSFPQHPI